MLVKIGNFEFTEVWDGVFYKKLSAYPSITDWEMRTLIEFTEYEEANGRDSETECKNAALREHILRELGNKEKYRSVPRPKLITECTACPYRRGCETEYVCHTSSVENAIKIFRCGSLLSAVRARGLPAEELMRESRNAANDPADYFDYVMLNWGNCQAGDRLVMERALGRFPNEEDLSVRFRPGVRFYFRYDELAKHPNRVFDGVLPMKVRDGIVLSEWVYRIVIPAVERDRLEKHIPENLRDRVLYVENDCRDIWDWSEKVYERIEKHDKNRKT